MASEIIGCNFPVEALVPKNETGVLAFLQKYPEFDGRDVTIAIMDSGVDPKAAGLQTTVDGAVKVIERFDCSGCGDVKMKKVLASSDGKITGKSGRTLTLTSHMIENNLNKNEYRVGLKCLNDLYPEKFREKLSADMKAKHWDEPHKTALTEAARDMAYFEFACKDKQNMQFAEKIRKEEIDSTIDFLNSYDKKYRDINTTYDCILYNTEKCWYAVIDTTENGDLENAVLLGEYSKTYDVKTIDGISISMNVHDDEEVLELVGICSSHGTHVTAIASGNHSNKVLDGAAPNAKIVSLTISDGRLGSMETGTALVRAIIKIMELCNSGTNIDIINTSYGEHAHWSNSGRVGELMNELINKYGVVWVCSAGNHGPALSTIGTPPDISQTTIIGVGAYISPQMMEAEYSMRENLPPTLFTWTSRDPCIDGGRGVTVCAPGAAIASVPEYTMTRAYHMNGTSMAAPHVAGAIALLLSGLKAREIKYSPYSIIRAISNTATWIDYVDKFAQGNGLLNVNKAFEYLLQYADQPENLIRFSVKVGLQNAKGIHLRQAGALMHPYETKVDIEPIFFNESEVDAKDKISFNIRLILTCSESWVHCGAYLDMCYTKRTITVKLDPTSLQEGVHTASIRAYDTKCIEKGPVFEIPVTVIKPHFLDCQRPSPKIFKPNCGIVQFRPNTIQRDFILVPTHATRAVLRMIVVNDNGNKRSEGKFFIHTMQLLSMKSCKMLETMRVLSVTSENEYVHIFKVDPNNILELCIAKYWSSVGESRLMYSIEFKGITSTNPDKEVMQAANGIHRIDLYSLGSEGLSPVCLLKSAVIALKPKSSKISPLGARDVIPGGRQIYQNILTYNLCLSKAHEIACYVPMLCQLLYESEFESQLWMLFDSNKMLIACGDAYSDKKSFKIEKGEYTIRLQVRHEKKEILEKISEATMLASIKLTNPIPLDIYDHYNQSLIGGRKITSDNMVANVPKTIFIAPLSSEKLNKAQIPPKASWLTGQISYTRDEFSRKCDNFVFNYILGAKPSNKNSESPKKTTLTTEEYNESVKDFKCSLMPKLGIAEADQLYNDMKSLFDEGTFDPKLASIHVCYIQHLEGRYPLGSCQYPLTFANKIEASSNIILGDHVERIIELAKIAVEQIDKEALLAYYGSKTDFRADAVKHKTDMDKEKSTLVEALVKKGIYICKQFIVQRSANKDNVTSRNELMDAIHKDIAKFYDPMDMKVIHFYIWHAYTQDQFGRMAKYLLKVYEEKLCKEALQELSLVVAYNWEHIEQIIGKQLVTCHPLNYRPF